MSSNRQERLVIFADAGVGSALATLAAISPNSPYGRVDIVASAKQASTTATARGIGSVVEWAQQNATNPEDVARVRVIKGRWLPKHHSQALSPPTALDLIHGGYLQKIEIPRNEAGPQRNFGKIFDAGQNADPYDVLSLGPPDDLGAFIAGRDVPHRIRKLVFVVGGGVEEVGVDKGPSPDSHVLKQALGNIYQGQIPITLVPSGATNSRRLQWNPVAEQIVRKLLEGCQHSNILLLLEQLLGKESKYWDHYKQMSFKRPGRDTAEGFSGPPVPGLVAFEALRNPGFFTRTPIGLTSNETGGGVCVGQYIPDSPTHPLMVVDGGLPWSPSARGLWEDVGSLYSGYR